MTEHPFSLGQRGEPLEIFHFSVRDDRKQIAKLLREYGFNVTAANIEQRASAEAAAVINGLTVAAKQTTQSFTPVDTGELRTQHIRNESTGAEGSVFVDDLTHYGRRRIPQEAATLAELLDAGDASKLSGAARNKDWIKDAQLAFQSGKDAVIRRSLRNGA